jgi:ribosomal protein S18 acetylase RimI-like enzyme
MILKGICRACWKFGLFDAYRLWRAYTIFENEIGKFMDQYQYEYLADQQHPFIVLYTVGVRPENQRQGYGRFLITRLQEYAQQKQADVYLEATTADSVRLYERLGFQATGRRIQPKVKAGDPESPLVICMAWRCRRD